jgi:hypothetical protein
MAKTVAGKILASIWETFKELFPSFIDKTYRKIEPELRQEISWITKIVDKMNEVLENQGIDILTSVIPGDADNDFVNWARKATSAYLEFVKRKEIAQLKSIDKANASALLTQDRTGMELSQALITSQVVYKKENG